jgi:SAM-dependent methyltransferase
LPDAELMFLVAGHSDPLLFEPSRRGAVDTIVQLLADSGVRIADLRSVLDFGCGCGRILAGWEGMLHPEARLYGCDINERLVRFCQENVKDAAVIQSSFMPPLPYADHQFDLIYAASVYTHLSLPAMLHWTGEIARILEPGGIAMITTHGSYYAPELARLSKPGTQLHAERGYYIHLHGTPEDTWEGSNNYATFATPEFMRRIFVGFDLLKAYPGISHGPNHFAAYQDILICRRSPTEV